MQPINSDDQIQVNVGDQVQVKKWDGTFTGVVTSIETYRDIFRDVHVTLICYIRDDTGKVDSTRFDLNEVCLVTPNGLIPVPPFPPQPPSPLQVFYSEDQILNEFPIVVKFRVRKDAEGQWHERVSNSDYKKLYELLSPNHRSSMRFFNSSLNKLEAKGLVHTDQQQYGFFAVLPVYEGDGDRGDPGDKIGENFLLLEQELGPVLFGAFKNLANAVGIGVAKGAGAAMFKFVVSAIQKEWTDAKGFKIGEIEIRVRGVPDRLVIPFSQVDIFNMDRPDVGNVYHYLVCLQKEFGEYQSLDPAKNQCDHLLGEITHIRRL